MMTQNEKDVFNTLRNDFLHYASRCLYIRAKSGAIQPLALNKAQLYLHDKIEQQKKERGWVRALVLKGRQQGVSTYVGGRFYWLTTHRQGFKTFILTHLASATTNLFRMVKRYNALCHDLVRPSTGTTNKIELVFDKLDSGYALGTAGSKDVGRSDTIQLLHGSEVGFWVNTSDIINGLMQTVPDAPDTEIILESTANGTGNMFHSYWQAAEAGESDYQAIFLPWFWQDEYRAKVDSRFFMTTDDEDYKKANGLSDEQMMWRQLKIIDFRIGGSDGHWRFRQEYPCTAAEAFQTSGEDSLIKPQHVLEARKASVVKQIASNIVGVDPARMGNDRTAIIRRKGRLAYDLEYHSKKDTMQVAGICANILNSEKIDKMFIDIGGLGAGVVDRLREMGYRQQVTGVNFGERALNADNFVNKRAEMWGNMAEWFAEGGCQITDSDEMQTDLTSPNFEYDSSGRLILESKKAMSKRGVRSPDGGDALALTFAFPVRLPSEGGGVIINSGIDFDPIGFT